MLNKHLVGGLFCFLVDLYKVNKAYIAITILSIYTESINHCLYPNPKIVSFRLYIDAFHTEGVSHKQNNTQLLSKTCFKRFKFQQTE